MTCGGTLPVRKPGIFMSRPSERATVSMLRSTSAAGTSTFTRTRDSGRSVTVALTAAGIRRTIASVRGP